MSRLTAILICLIAAAIGLQPWIGQARTDDAVAQASEKAAEQTAASEEATPAHEQRASYLRDLIRREVAAMKSQKTSPKSNAEVPVEEVTNAEGAMREQQDEAPDDQTAVPSQPEISTPQMPLEDTQAKGSTPSEPASASDLAPDEPNADSNASDMEGPTFLLPDDVSDTPVEAVVEANIEANSDTNPSLDQLSSDKLRKAAEMPAQARDLQQEKKSIERIKPRPVQPPQPESVVEPIPKPEVEKQGSDQQQSDVSDPAAEKIELPLSFPESSTPELPQANQRLEEANDSEDWSASESYEDNPSDSDELLDDVQDSSPLFEAPRPLPAVEVEKPFTGPPLIESAVDQGEVSVLLSVAETNDAGRNRFPALPPDPYAEQKAELTPLDDELLHHGGPYLYEPEGAGFQQQALMTHCESHENHHSETHQTHANPPLRLPEWHQAPQPITAFAEYLGADPIQTSHRAWPGPGGYEWEPRFVAYGRYDVFGVLFQENDRRQDFVGHNLTLDADLRLTGTERFHIQHRPVGEDGTGGSFYRFDNPEGYVDNSTAAPSRLWFEGEVASLLSGWLDGGSPTAWDMNLAIGLFPLGLHNNLLMNDEVAGIVIGQNNGQLENLSNLNVRGFWLWDEVDAFQDVGVDLLGVDAFIDYRHAFIEATYAYRKHGRTRDLDAHYLAVSGTQFFGPSTFSARALAKVAGPLDEDGQLFVAEWNTHRRFDQTWAHRLGVEHGVFYANAFWATQGWSPISGANFNRIRSSFEVNPLVLIARGDRDDTPGLALGVQLFGEEDHSSLTPEIAWEAPGGQSVFGTGIRYQRRTSVSSFLELRGLINFSEQESLERDGLFTSHHWLF